LGKKKKSILQIQTYLLAYHQKQLVKTVRRTGMSMPWN